MHTDGICYRELQIVQRNYSLIETDLVLLPNGPFIGKNDDFGRRCFSQTNLDCIQQDRLKLQVKHEATASLFPPSSNTAHHSR